MLVTIPPESFWNILGSLLSFSGARGTSFERPTRTHRDPLALSMAGYTTSWLASRSQRCASGWVRAAIGDELE